MKQRRHLDAAARLDALTTRLADPGATWGEVMNLLDCWPPDQDPETAIARVEAEAHRWPAEARTLSGLAGSQLLAGVVRPHLRLIRALDLTGVWIRERDGVVRRMIDEGGLHELVEFTTRYDDGDRLLELLVAHIIGLRRLHIGGSDIGPTGAGRLAACPALARLEELSLPNNRLGDAGAEALLASPHLTGLRSLNLYSNGLSTTMVERILAAPQWQSTTIVHHNQKP